MTMLHRMLILLLLPALAIAAVQFVAARAARDESRRALARLDATVAQVRTIESLSDRTAQWAQRGRPPLAQGGLTTAVNEALASAGLPAASLASLSPAAEMPIALRPAAASGSSDASAPGLAAVRQRALLTLAPISLPQVGRFLSAWREAHPDWTISAIDFSPEAPGRREPSPGSDLPLRVVITLETLFVEPAAALPTASGALR
jgi:hypothetical protein